MPGAEARSEPLKAATPLDGALGLLARLPLFTEAGYLALHPDVAQAGIPAGQHALVNGCAEGRVLFTSTQRARVWGDAVLRTARIPDPPQAPRGAGRFSGAVSIFVSSWSEPSTVFLAEGVARELEDAGAAPVLRSERDARDMDLGTTIVVAPQDFFRLGVGPSWRPTGLIQSSLMLNTASLAHPQIESALPFLLSCRGILDLSPQMADIFAQAGLPARHIRPRLAPRTDWLAARDVDHPLVRALPAAARRPDAVPSGERPLDVSFFGRATPRRKKMLARVASDMAHRRSFFYVQQPWGDALDEAVDRRAFFRIAGHLAGRSRTVLRIADDEVPTLDWLDTYQAMAAGAAVVTDACPPHPDLQAGVHLFQADTRHLADMVLWLTEDTDGREAAAKACVAAQTVLAQSTKATPWMDLLEAR